MFSTCAPPPPVASSVPRAEAGSTPVPSRWTRRCASRAIPTRPTSRSSSRSRCRAGTEASTARRSARQHPRSTSRCSRRWRVADPTAAPWPSDRGADDGLDVIGAQRRCHTRRPPTVSTSSGPSAAGGWSTSATFAEPATPGSTVRARITRSLHRSRRAVRVTPGGATPRPVSVRSCSALRRPGRSRQCGRRVDDGGV